MWCGPRMVRTTLATSGASSRNNAAIAVGSPATAASTTASSVAGICGSPRLCTTRYQWPLTRKGDHSALRIFAALFQILTGARGAHSDVRAWNAPEARLGPPAGFGRGDQRQQQFAHHFASFLN